MLMTLREEALENVVWKGENVDNQHFTLFPCFPAFQSKVSIFQSLLIIFLSLNSFELDQSKTLFFGKAFPKWQILNSSKVKEFEDDNFKFDENGRKFSKRILLFQQCFQKTCNTDTFKPGLVLFVLERVKNTYEIHLPQGH